MKRNQFVETIFRFFLKAIFLLMFVFLSCSLKQEEKIKALDIDFNWGMGGPNNFAGPGVYAHADPKAHVQWYKDMGANIIQTFCVSCNGYAWYKNGKIPEQPGLKTDFLRDIVRLAHEENMRVMGYYCIAANTRWGMKHPDQSYGTPADYHIPLTDDYMSYLKHAIIEGVETGIDGFMIDWIWPPHRVVTNGKWIESEKRLYEQLMDEPFPGEHRLTEEKENIYGLRSVERCWENIYTTAKKTNPDIIIWLTCNDLHSPMVPESMLQECDWIMNESPESERIEKMKERVGENTKLIQVVTNGMGNNYNSAELFKKLEGTGVEFYGFARPNPVTTFPELAVEAIGNYTELTRNLLAIREMFRGKPNNLEELMKRFRVFLFGRQARLHGSQLKTGENIWSRIYGWQEHDWAEWDFIVPQPDKYEVWLHYVSEHPSVKVSIDINGMVFTSVLENTLGQHDVVPVKIGAIDIKQESENYLILRPLENWNTFSVHYIELARVDRD
jgi:hypothetical protein